MPNQRNHHKYKPLGAKTNGLDLRPWDEVARLFRERTGQHMTGKLACMVANAGLQKVQTQLEACRGTK